MLQRLKRRAPAAVLLCAALGLAGCAGNTTLGESKRELKTVDAPVVAGQGAQVKTLTQLQKFMWFFSPYRPDIQQGNFISLEMLQQLKTGMTREQVRFILGTPLVQDIFHADRWDYPFRLARGNGETVESAVAVFFKDGKVERWEGGNLPTEKEYIALIAGPPKNAKDLQTQRQAADAPKPSAPLPAGQDSATPAPVEVNVKKN